MTKDDRLIIFFAGVGLGVAGTLFLAPASGREIRARLRNGADKTGGYLKEQAANLTAPLADAVAKGQQAFHEAVSKGSGSVSNLKEKMEDASDQAKNALNKTVDKSREVAHQAGKTIEQGGKRLQEV